METDIRNATGNVAREETFRLIASNEVEGTSVYNRKGETLGKIYNFMVDKATGQVAYAVLSFGGFLGMGESYYPLPWKALNYDTNKDGYVIDLDKSRLENAPSYAANTRPNWSNRAYGLSIDQFYGY